MDKGLKKTSNNSEFVVTPSPVSEEIECVPSSPMPFESVSEFLFTISSVPIHDCSDVPRWGHHGKLIFARVPVIRYRLGTIRKRGELAARDESDNPVGAELDEGA